MIELVLRIVFWGLLLLAAARVGSWLVGSRLTGLSHLAWDGTTGLALFIGVMLAVGLVPGTFQPAAIALVLALLAVAAVFFAWRDPVRRFERNGGARGAWILLGLVAVVGLLWNRVPPVFFDTLAYHYAQPELWLVEARIAPERWSLHSWFPPGMSVLFGVGMAFGDATWANDANLLAGLLLLALIFDLGRRRFDAPVGVASMLLLLGLPVIPYAIAVPAADLGHGLFVVAALGALLRDDASRTSPWLRRAALCAAGAVLTKYLGLLVPLAVGVLWLLVRSRDLRRVVVFAGPAALLIAPWLVANLLTVGNPVAPVFSGLLPPEGLAPGGAERFNVDARGGLPDLRALALLGPRLFTGDVMPGRPYPTPAWSWLPLVLAPVTLLALRTDRRLRSVAGLAAGLLLVWLLTFRIERFLVAATSLMALALAGGAVHAWRRGGLARTFPVLAALIGALVVVQTGLNIERFTGGLVVARGVVDRQSFTENAFPAAGLYRLAREELDASSQRVLLVGEMRHFGLALPHAAPSGFNTHPLAEALTRLDEPEAVHRELRRQGYTHLIVDPGWVRLSAERYPSLVVFREPGSLERFLASLKNPIATRGSVALFEIP